MRMSEAETDWQKSSFSGTGPGNDCMELAGAGGGIRMRESDDAGVVVAAGPTVLAGLLRHVKAGGGDVRA